MDDAARLPKGLTVFERGWLSANNILFTGKDAAALVDSGYWTHARQTVALVEQALGTRPLDLLLNTHLHSDHCGGNAMLRQRYPALQIGIPPGQASQVSHWDPIALTYTPTGQHCPRFEFTQTLEPGRDVELGDLLWQIHGAPGHDPHSIILFEPGSRTLISADALWENGFGVVFPELEGTSAFTEVAATIDLIEALAPRIVVPGHGKVFIHVKEAIARSRSRLESFVRDPRKHAAHAAKVLLKFKLLELQQSNAQDFYSWATTTAYFQLVHRRYFREVEMGSWLEELVASLVQSGVAQRHDSLILNA
jgi:glyoxylase-like metal-dependent hydrolase (beta-lactamase superfamily II)